MSKLSEPMIRVMLNLLRGKDPSYGREGRSEFGGLTRTLWALRVRKIIDDSGAVCKLTELGQKLAEETQARRDQVAAFNRA